MRWAGHTSEYDAVQPHALQRFRNKGNPEAGGDKVQRRYNPWRFLPDARAKPCRIAGRQNRIVESGTIVTSINNECLARQRLQGRALFAAGTPGDHMRVR